MRQCVRIPHTGGYHTQTNKNECGEPIAPLKGNPLNSERNVCLSVAFPSKTKIIVVHFTVLKYSLISVTDNYETDRVTSNFILYHTYSLFTCQLYVTNVM